MCHVLTLRLIQNILEGPRDKTNEIKNIEILSCSLGDHSHLIGTLDIPRSQCLIPFPYDYMTPHSK